MSRQIARRLLAVAFLLGLSAEMLFHGSAAGINVPVVVGLCLVAAWLARRTSAPIDRLDWWIAPTAFGLAAGVALRADDWLVGADIGAALFLTVAAVVSFNGVALTRLTTTTVAGIAIRAILLVHIGAMWIVGDSLPRSGPTRSTLGRGVPIARGLLLAAPVVTVFGSQSTS